MKINSRARIRFKDLRPVALRAWTVAAILTITACTTTARISPTEGTVPAYQLDQHTESLGILAQDHDALGRPRPSSVLDFYLELGERGLKQVYGAIGALYMQGVKGPPDYSSARDWLERSSEVGQPLGTHNLGYLHEKGLDTPRNMPRAIELYRSAALLGFAPSMFNLGVLSETGEGLPQDSIEALKWYRLAAQHTERNEGDLMKAAILRAERLATEIGDVQTDEADRRAAEWSEQLSRPR